MQQRQIKFKVILDDVDSTLKWGQKKYASFWGKKKNK